MKLSNGKVEVPVRFSKPINKIIKGLDNFLSFLAAEKCYACGNRRGFICPDCYRLLPFNKNFCIYCAYPLPMENKDLICGKCLKEKPIYEKAISPLIYENFIRKIMLDAKFGGKYQYYYMLLNQTEEYIEDLISQIRDVDAIVPIPLSKKRLVERGYNQAILIAKFLSKKINRPLILDVLAKIKDTKPQSQLGERERTENIKDAFMLKKSINFDKIILVDDIITSTATIKEGTKVLKKGGVNEIYIFSLCRAVF